MGPLTSGALIGGRYRLLHEAGRGGMATVWRAQDVLTPRIVAVKFLDLAALQDSYTRDHYRDRFLREGVMTAKVRSPHIPEVFSTGRDGADRPYIVLEFVNGPTLATYIARLRPLDISVVTAIAGQICIGLTCAHEAGIIHRDLKPSNIMINQDGIVKIMDFGIAKALDGTRLTSTGGAPGTCAYMAPEQFDTGMADHRADLYACGCVITEMCTGERVFPGAVSPVQQMRAHREQKQRSLRTIRREVPNELDQLVSDLLEKQPYRRPESAHHVLSRLQDMLPLRGEDPPSRRYQPDPTAPWRLAGPQARTSVSQQQKVQRPKYRRRSGPSIGTIRQAHDKALDLARRGDLSAAIDFLIPLLEEAEPFHGSRSEIVFELRLALADLQFTDNQITEARRQYLIAREYASEQADTGGSRLAMIQARIEDCDEVC